MTKIKCKICGQILESKYRHDYIKCSCGKTFVDGGNSYLRTTIYGEVILNEN